MSSDEVLARWARAPLTPRFLGRLPYAQVVERGRAQREAYLSGQRREAVWLAEHDWTLTTGRRAVPDLPPPPFWQKKGVATVETERGGLATLHGPGQVVAMLVIDLHARGLGVKRAVHAIEGGLITWLARQGVQASARCGAPGVWVGNDKIGSIGLHIRRGVCLHGFALNLDVDLEPFGWFTPCGVVGAGTTSVRDQVGSAPAPPECALELANEVLWSLLQSTIDRASVNQ